MLTTRPPRVCLYPGCGEAGQWPRGYCPKHSGRQGRPQRPLEKLYRQTAWLQIFRPRFLSFNRICQKLTGKERCHKPANQLHHLVDPQTPKQFYDPYNIVALCNEHHTNEPGTPHWKVGVDYVATEWRAPSIPS